MAVQQANQFSYAGNAASDLFSGFATYEGDETKAEGLETEATNDTAAAALATQDAEVASENLGVQEYQEERALSKAQGTTESEYAAGGFQTSGTAVDVLRSNAQEGAMQEAVTNIQGQSTIEGYQEQATAYENLASYASSAAGKEKELGVVGAVGAGVGAALNIAAMFAA
jgi:hypothetical protein